MVKRTSLDDATCPIARTLDVIGDWWSLLIVRDAMLGKRRFGEFQKSLGVAKNILAARLKTLVEQEILEIVPAADGGAYHDYVLTERGRSLYLVVSALRQWGEENMFGPANPAPFWWTRKTASRSGNSNCTQRMGGCWVRGIRGCGSGHANPSPHEMGCMACKSSTGAFAGALCRW